MIVQAPAVQLRPIRAYLGFRFLDSACSDWSCSSGKIRLVTRRPNLSPTFTHSPSAIGWPLTSSSSISSHDLSNAIIEPGTSSIILPIDCFFAASVTVTGTWTFSRLRL